MRFPHAAVAWCCLSLMVLWASSTSKSNAASRGVISQAIDDVADYDEFNLWFLRCLTG
jgi:hypothetical protein